MRTITIKPALNGWIIKVGCNEGTVLFTDKTFLLNAISRYIDTPEKVEAEYIKNRVNKMGSDDERTPRPLRETEVVNKEPG